MGDTVTLTAAKQCRVQHPISHEDSSARAASARLAGSRDWLLLPADEAASCSWALGLELAGDWLRLGVAEGERLSLWSGEAKRTTIEAGKGKRKHTTEGRHVGGVGWSGTGICDKGDELCVMTIARKLS